MDTSEKRIRIEEMSLSELFVDYKSLEGLKDRYYYAGELTTKLRLSVDAMKEMLSQEIVKRTFKELEANYGLSLKAKGPIISEEPDAPKDYVYIPSVGDFVYTEDYGETFKCCEPNEFNFAKGILVGLLVSSIAENGQYTICALPEHLRNLPLLNKTYTIDKDALITCDQHNIPVFIDTEFDVAHDINGIARTKFLDTMYTPSSVMCAIKYINEWRINGLKNNPKWYIPSCGEMCLVDSKLWDYINQNLSQNYFYGVLTSNIINKDYMWTYNIKTHMPNRSDIRWDYLCIPFSKVKIEL